MHLLVQKPALERPLNHIRVTTVSKLARLFNGDIETAILFPSSNAVYPEPELVDQRVALDGTFTCIQLTMNEVPIGRTVRIKIHRSLFDFRSIPAMVVGGDLEFIVAARGYFHVWVRNVGDYGVLICVVKPNVNVVVRIKCPAGPKLQIVTTGCQTKVYGFVPSVIHGTVKDRHFARFISSSIVFAGRAFVQPVKRGFLAAKGPPAALPQCLLAIAGAADALLCSPFS